MNYRICQTSGENWAIVDDRQECVFEGTMRECEDWLDHQENAPERQPRSTWREWILGFFGLRPRSSKVRPATRVSKHDDVNSPRTRRTPFDIPKQH